MDRFDSMRVYAKAVESSSFAGAAARRVFITCRGERCIWQRRYSEHTIGDDRDFAAHMDHTHFNAVKLGPVAHPTDWPHPSFHRCVNIGLYPAGWSGGSDEPQETGEAAETSRGHDR